MTHTLHRRGTVDSLSRDYVVLCMAAMGFNDAGSKPKLQEFLRICMRYNPVNAGSVNVGNMVNSKVEDMPEKIHRHVHAVFDRADTVTQVLRDLKQADLGLSVVVSGLLDTVERCCQDAGLNRHTVEVSLGTWGRVEKLPPKEVLELTTMCGHGLIGANLVAAQVAEMKDGRRTADKASKELARQCACGIFNIPRGQELLSSLATRPN
jgi:hypothetical protein